MVHHVPAESEITALKFLPNLSLARRVAADIGCNDAHEVHRAIQRRCPGVLQIHVRRDELSREEYEDLCFAIESEVAHARRVRGVPMLKLERSA
jgi:hypothetical protein